jgi:7-keto-8-aminopelargonate synthetase-like enzyme
MRPPERAGMETNAERLEIINAAVHLGTDRGVLHLTAEDDRLDGRTIRIDERPRLNFASCSYLGLELDPRLRDGAVNAACHYGTQFSSSRAYVSMPLYRELESLLDRIFDAHTLVIGSTTLAHLAALPVLIDPRDAVLLDHQVHQSVQLAIPQLHLQGVSVEFVRHGRVDLLEKRIRELAASHRHVWYLVDGVFSMYGDFAPMKALSWLLERYEQLHLYIDDAHGMSWCGRHGRGFAAEALRGHERVVIAASLNKSFGAAGGVIAFPDRAQEQMVRHCGSTVMFAGPVQPPMLGAAVASAKIHLSPEIEQLQAKLLHRIRYVNRVARKLDIPLVSESEVPIRYVGLGVNAAALDMAEYLMKCDIFTNPAGFPAVGSRNAGVRFTVTLHQSLRDIQRVLDTIAERMPVSLARAGTDRAQVARAFGTAPLRGRAAARAPCGAGALRCTHQHSIRSLDAREWNRCLGRRGTFDAATLELMEAAFGEEQKPENRWRFHYYVVRDAGGRIVLATFFTEALWKDDMLAAARVSREVERGRGRDPYFLTSRSLAMGSLLTEGNHLYLDRDADWKAALSLMLVAVNAQRDECGAPTLVIRDLPDADEELEAALEEAGFVRLSLPDSMVIDLDWSSVAEFLAARSKRERHFHREKVNPWWEAYDVEILEPRGRRPSPEEWSHLYGLYRAVHARQLVLNTFPLPDDLLPRIPDCSGWELILLRLRPECGGDAGAFPQGFVACHAGPQVYSPLFVGMDYDLVESHGLYRQLLARSVWRARALGSQRVAFGMGSELEKTRFGARAERRGMYVQSHDRYQHDVLELLAAGPS